MVYWHLLAMFKSSSCKAAKILWPSKVPAHSRAIALDSTLSALVSMQRFVRLRERPSGSLASVFDDDQMGVAKCSLHADRPSSTQVFKTSREERSASALSLSKARQIAIPKPLAAIFLRSLAKAAWCCD